MQMAGNTVARVAPQMLGPAQQNAARPAGNIAAIASRPGSPILVEDIVPKVEQFRAER